MSKIVVSATLALLCLGQPAFAQEQNVPRQGARIVARGADRETLDASMARLAMKAALQPSARPSRQELLGFIVLMSLREHRDKHI